MELAGLIYTRRKAKGLSQEQLAESLGVARQTVSKWETGETLPDVESLRKLAIVLGFSADEALGIPKTVNEDEDDDDSIVWLMIGGFVIGTGLGIAFENYILGFAFAMVGYGGGMVIRAIKKNGVIK